MLEISGNMVYNVSKVIQMQNILFINACVRSNSRTLELAEFVLTELDGKVCKIDLELENIKPLDKVLLKKRERLVSENDFSDDMFRYAKEFAAADTIILAAPYWDLTFPALLKIYLEQITVCGLTFKYSNGAPLGLCRAKRLIYVTTAGGPVYYNFGFEYVKTLAENFYGIKDVRLFKAENLDIEGADVKEIMQAAKNEVYENLQ